MYDVHHKQLQPLLRVSTLPLAPLSSQFDANHQHQSVSPRHTDHTGAKGKIRISFGTEQCTQPFEAVLAVPRAALSERRNAVCP